MIYKLAIILALLAGCSSVKTEQVKNEQVKYKGRLYSVHSTNKKHDLDGYVCQSEFIHDNRFYCIEAAQPTCELIDRKVMGPMLKLIYQCGENKDIIYRYVGDKDV